MRQHHIWCVCVRAFCVERCAGLQSGIPLYKGKCKCFLLGKKCILTSRGTNLMKQLRLIILNISTCFGHLYGHLQEYRLYRNRCVFLCTVCEFVSDTQCTRLLTGSLGPQPQHSVLNTICSSIQPVLLKMAI